MQRVKFWIIFFALQAVVMVTIAQTRTSVPGPEIDSLIRIIPQFESRERVDHLNQLAKSFVIFIYFGRSVPKQYADSLFYYANMARNLARSLEYDYGEALAHFYMDDSYLYKFDLKRSMLNYLMASRLLENIPGEEARVELASVIRDIGLVCRYGGMYTEAEKYFRKALSIFTDLDLKLYIAYCYTQLHQNFLNMKVYDSAYHYSELRLKIIKETNNEDRFTFAYSGIAASYLWLDEDTPIHERTLGSLALPYLDTALYFAERLDNKMSKIDCLVMMGECYHLFINPPDYKLAEKYYKQSLNELHTLVNEQVGDKKDQRSDFLRPYLCLGELYIDKGNHAQGKKYLDSSLAVIDSFYISLDTARYAITQRQYNKLYHMYWFKSELYRVFNKYYRSTGNFESASFYLRLKEKIRDSLQQVETRNQIGYLLAREESANIQNRILLLEKEKELEQNKAERSRFIIIGLGLLLFIAILIGYILIRQKQLQSEQEKMRLQQKLFRTQMNPHFIFNSLASIQHLVVDEDPEKASIYLAKFSTLVRSVLYSSNKDSITMDDELKTIESYLALQKIRYSNKFEYTIDVDPQIDTESLTIPPMLAQPFIENAIEHGIRHKEGKGNIAVRFGLKDGSVHLEVEDDGVGREKSYELEKGMQMDHRSMATEITRERLRILNRKLRQKISFAISDLMDKSGFPKGTQVNIVLPVAVV